MELKEPYLQLDLVLHVHSRPLVSADAVPVWPEAGLGCLLRTTQLNMWPVTARGKAQAGQSGASSINHNACLGTSSDSQPIYTNHDKGVPKAALAVDISSSRVHKPSQQGVCPAQCKAKSRYCPSSPALTWETHPRTRSWRSHTVVQAPTAAPGIKHRYSCYSKMQL